MGKIANSRYGRFRIANFKHTWAPRESYLRVVCVSAFELA